MQHRTVIAGLDGSPESLTAAEWAAREAIRRGLPLHLAMVYAWHPYTHGPMSPPTARRHWTESIPREAAARLRRVHPGLEITSAHLAGQPASMLPLLADEAELLVLGSRGLSGIVGFLVGSVSLATVGRAHRPVVLVRAGERAEDEHLPDAGDRPSRQTPYRDVVLGLDLARPCDDLLEFAFDTAARRGARLRVIHGWNMPSLFDYAPQAVAVERGEVAADRACALTDALRPWRGKFPDVQVDEQLVAGRPGPHLVHASSGAGLVIVGRRVRRAPAGTRIGPVTQAVLHHSSAPVAVVPHD